LYDKVILIKKIKVMAHATPPNPRARQYQGDSGRRLYDRDIADFRKRETADHKKQAAEKAAAEKAAAEKAKKLKGGRVATAGSKRAKADVGKMKVGKTTTEVAREVGRSGKRAGKAGVEVAKSTLKSVHELTMSELFPTSKKS
jgi:hypothetical protein